MKRAKFSILTKLPTDPIYGMQVTFKSDPRPNKINLSIGVCQDPTGKVIKFEATTKAEEQLHLQKLSKEYLPIVGYQPFCKHIAEVVCGKSANPLFSMQTVGGTGALYVAAKLLLNANIKEIFISEPTWPNHRQLFEASGLQVRTYPYYDRSRAAIDFDAMIDAIKKMPKESAILLQASCHNPTGVDPTPEQWTILSDLILERQITPLFDLAYQGLGESLEKDSTSIRLFLEAGHELLVATTLAKSLGLYNERVGALIASSSKEALECLESHAKVIARCCYSSPPAHGAQIAACLFSDNELVALWNSELEKTRKQLRHQRELLFTSLQKNRPPFAFDHLMHTNGLFCLFDLSERQVHELREKHAIYVALDGRICLAAITEKNVDTITQAFCELS